MIEDILMDACVGQIEPNRRRSSVEARPKPSYGVGNKLRAFY